MNKLLVTLFLVCFTLVIKADPAPFGLEIGKATIKMLQIKYKAQSTGKNKYSDGEMYDLDVNQIGIEGLQSVTAIFDKNNKLVAILTTFPKSKFDFLFNTMRQKKYKLAKKNIPFVGNKSAEYKNGNTTIFLDSPHLSFKMDMNYVNNEFWETYQNIRQEEVQNKKRSEQSKL